MAEGSATLDRARAAEEEAYNLRTETVQIGRVARALELRALAQQHRAGYTEFLQVLDTAVQKAKTKGLQAGWAFLRTDVMADVDLVGLVPSKAARWRIEQEVRSPFYVRKLLSDTPEGERERTWFAAYVEKHALKPGLEALWHQLAGKEQDPIEA